jgi:hypothetical protein
MIQLGEIVILSNRDPLDYAIYTGSSWAIVRAHMASDRVESGTKEYPSFIEAKRAHDAGAIVWEG